MAVPIRIQAMGEALKLAAKKVHEEGGNNHGFWIRAFLRATDAGVDSAAWCCAMVVWCLDRVGYDVKQIHNRASVGYFEQWAEKAGYLVSRPLKGDIVTFRFDDDNWPDHIGFVVKVLGLGPILTLKTVEGNTSSGEAGSQDDGDGVFVRRRVIRRSKLRFIRIPD